MLSLAIKLLDFFSGGKLRLAFAGLSLLGIILAQLLPKDSSIYAWVVAITSALSAYAPNLKPTLEKVQASRALKVAADTVAELPPPATETPSAQPGEMKVDGHSQESADEYQRNLFNP